MKFVVRVTSTSIKSILVGNKQGLFDDIVGFEDVKSLFEMAIKS